MLPEKFRRCPNVLPVGDFYPYVTDLISLGREIPIDIGARRTGYVDNLFVTNDAYLVVVETKLHRNSGALYLGDALQWGRVLQS
jgi:hypothetical protein